jgi:hypothetical protein
LPAWHQLGKQQRLPLRIDSDDTTAGNTDPSPSKSESTKTKAVISQPLDYVPAQPTPVPGSLAIVRLDGSSSTAQTGATITKAVWAITSSIDNKSVANATGLVADVLLAPGQYTAGLLVIDSLLGNAVASKKFEVVRPPPSSAEGDRSGT